jgi:hypothetical protein
MQSMKRRFFAYVSFILFMTVLSFSGIKGEDELLTVAESSHFTATSRYADVLDFVRKLQGKSALIRTETLCVSPEGRAVPLLIIGNPPPSSPRTLNHDPRAVVYIQGNIHAGEVEGKEAALMLARDILLDEKLPYLDQLVILIAPIFNADGNEKISPDNRRNQVGPEKGVGVRYNGQNLDLNRDSMKLESPELQGLVRNVLGRWDPALLVDLHTTNGSYHEEPVTYSWPLNPNGDLSIIAYMRDKMMPWINTNLQEKYRTLSVPYGNFTNYRDPEKGWRTFSHHPRFVTNYIGLRNRLAILDENYSYADYKTRVFGCYSFLCSILDYCALNKGEIMELLRQADQNTIKRGMKPTAEDTFGTSFEVRPLEKPVTIRGYEMEILSKEGARPRVKRTERKKTYTVPYFADFIPKESVQLPFAYLIPLNDPALEEKLLLHGLTVEKLTEAATLEVESFTIKEIKANPRLYQGHYMNSVSGEYVTQVREFPTGTLCVGMAQPLANLAAYLLEAESDDGLLVWNFFDRYITSQWGRRLLVYPVHRLLTPTNLVKETVR